MRVLEIVHGFPPEAAGGTELYAEAHARAMHAEGADVVVLAREADTSSGEYAIRRETRDGIRIVRINNTFRNISSFEDGYCSKEIGAIAARLIEETAPDVAHVHHLTGLSTDIIHTLAARGIPSIL